MPTTVVSPDAGPINLPFTDVEITRSINQLPTAFGQLATEGMFPIDPIATPYVSIDIENDVISALPVTGDGPATVARHGTGDERIFRVPHIEHQDAILAADIRGMLAIAARAKKPETLADRLNKRLMTLKRKFDLTREILSMTSLKGVITDGAGAEIYNLFTAFGISKKIVYFNFSNATEDIQAKCDLVYQLITQDLSDEVMTTVRVKASRSFFSKLISHPKVAQYWLNAQQALQLANLVRGNDGGYRPRTFEFGNILWEEYSAVAPMWGGASTPLIAADKAHAFPGGTLDSHVTYQAPPMDVRELDGEPPEEGDWMHVTTEPMKHGKGIEVLGQSDILPLWRRPKLLVELDAGSGSSTTPLGE